MLHKILFKNTHITEEKTMSRLHTALCSGLRELHSRHSQLSTLETRVSTRTVQTRITPRDEGMQATGRERDGRKAEQEAATATT